MEPLTFCCTKKFLKLFYLLSAFLVIACSGGGGGSAGGGDGNPKSGGNNIVNKTFTFDGVEGEGPDPAPIILLREGFSDIIVDSQILTGALQWLNVHTEFDQATGELSYVATPVFTDGPFQQNIANLPANVTHQGTADITYIRNSGATGELHYTFSYTPKPALGVVTGISLNIDRIDAANNILQLPFTVTNNRKTGSLRWTTSTSDKWLLLANGSGNTESQNQEQVSLVTTETDKFFGGQYTGKITISSSAVNVSPVDIPVTLNVFSPRVNFVSPAVATAGRQDIVILRGSGFTAVENPAVLFGTTEGNNLQIVSDTEIRVKYTNLTPGTYTVSVVGSNMTLPSSAELTVKTAPKYAYTFVADGVTPYLHKRRVFYDAVREKIYEYNSNNFFQWYEYTGTSWQHSLQTKGGHAFRDMSLAPNGKYFCMLSVDGYMDEYDVNTFLTADARIASTSAFLMNIDGIGSAGFANDGSLIVVYQNPFTTTIVHRARFDTLSKRVVPLDMNFAANLPVVDSVIVEMSADGSRGILGYITSSGTPAPVEYYIATSNQILDTGLTLDVTHVSLDGQGNKSIINRSIYDKTFQLIGDLPGTTLTSVMSPDGNWAYTYESTPNSGFHKYDLSSTNADGFFNEATSGKTIPDSPGDNPVMTISPDGGTLFLLGDFGLIVSPVP